tara:strand:+ start:1207 stop:1422 length:216 start_codon:yes stop_codon:yes gene_type:complete
MADVNTYFIILSKKDAAISEARCLLISGIIALHQSSEYSCPSIMVNRPFHPIIVDWISIHQSLAQVPTIQK